ncbi:carbohydrate ABC transporter permease [Actinokineospora enzanensis]|uniref:carbohydrate ABC transporter permease n=1 Tax=Actinokineospora enzanensis TaxID=155975 RepID=UPI0006875414|nr:carbohydrate ABC transporter permease [Actinokineospora enzanensis]
MVLLSLFPLYWSFVMATHDNSAIASPVPPLLPGGHLMANLTRMFDTVDFWAALRNSFLVAGIVSVANVLLSTMAGFAFALLRFPGRDKLFVAVVGSMLIPNQLGIIPMYLLVGALGWQDTLVAVIVPGMVSAYSVFWMRQVVREAISADLVDAARVDGCSPLRIYRHVVFPCLRPHAVVLAMLTFIASWNDFFWPLVVLDSNDTPTVQVALSRLAGGYFTDFSLLLTGVTMGTLPVVALFLLLAGRIVDGVSRGAINR